MIIQTTVLTIQRQKFDFCLIFLVTEDQNNIGEEILSNLRDMLLY